MEIWGKAKEDYACAFRGSGLEVHPDRLIEKPGLHERPCTLGLSFLEPLQSEKTGGVSFVDGYFKISCRVEYGGLLALRNICVGFSDPVDHFIPAKNDLEPAALPLGIEIFSPDINDDILEVIDENDLSFDVIVSQQRP